MTAGILVEPATKPTVATEISQHRAEAAAHFAQWIETSGIAPSRCLGVRGRREETGGKLSRITSRREWRLSGSTARKIEKLIAIMKARDRWLRGCAGPGLPLPRKVKQ